jgi:hypothetical protein
LPTLEAHPLLATSRFGAGAGEPDDGELGRLVPAVRAIRDFPDDLQMVVASSKRDRLRGRLASRRPLVCGQ